MALSCLSRRSAACAFVRLVRRRSHYAAGRDTGGGGSGGASDHCVRDAHGALREGAANALPNR